MKFESCSTRSGHSIGCPVGCVPMRTILLLALSSPLAALLVPAAGVRAGVLVPAPSVRHRAASMVDETGKGAIGGAVLGGLLAGPFGALWGAQLGGSLGANARAKREDTERWQRMGVTPNMLDSAQRVAAELADAEEGLRIVQAASESQSSLMETLDQGISDAYAAAETSLKAGDEAAARERLLERKQLQSKRELVAVELAAANERVSSMAGSVRALQLQVQPSGAIYSLTLPVRNCTHYDPSMSRSHCRRQRSRRRSLRLLPPPP